MPWHGVAGVGLVVAGGGDVLDDDVGNVIGVGVVRGCVDVVGALLVVDGAVGAMFIRSAARFGAQIGPQTE